jgi:hypothetical protein
MDRHVNEIFGERLDDWNRFSKNMSRNFSEADRCQKDFETVCRILILRCGETRRVHDVLKKVAELLGVSPC